MFQNLCNNLIATLLIVIFLFAIADISSRLIYDLCERRDRNCHLSPAPSLADYCNAFNIEPEEIQEPILETDSNIKNWNNVAPIINASIKSYDVDWKFFTVEDLRGLCQQTFNLPIRDGKRVLRKQELINSISLAIV